MGVDQEEPHPSRGSPNLGEPHKVKINNNPRVDQIYHYSGDLDADGEENHGLVQFFKDRVVSFQSPFEG